MLTAETTPTSNAPETVLNTPLKVFSKVLGETIYLVAKDAQAAAVWAEGGTPYTLSEVAILLEVEASGSPETWADRLRLIHGAKKNFLARLRQRHVTTPISDTRGGHDGLTAWQRKMLALAEAGLEGKETSAPPRP